jgi:hypothetical protein
MMVPDRSIVNVAADVMGNSRPYELLVRHGAGQAQSLHRSTSMDTIRPRRARIPDQAPVLAGTSAGPKTTPADHDQSPDFHYSILPLME